MKIESKIGQSAHSDQSIYKFITNFHNFRDFLPEGRVTGWEASEDRCAFNVEPIGRTGLQIIRKEPFKEVKIISDPEFSSYKFTIWIQLVKAGEQDTRIRITVEPEVSRMLLPVIRGPLKKFADGLIDRMEGFDFPEPGDQG